MAQPTMLMYVAVASQVLPPLAGATRRFASRAYVWIAAACVASIGGDIAQRFLGSQGINNLWVSYLSTPLVGTGFLLGLAELQSDAVSRLALRIAVPVYIVVWFVLTMQFEDRTSFSRFAYPVHALLLLSASLWTLVLRGLHPWGGPVWREAWFWIAGGLAIHSAATAALEPVLVVFMPDRVDLVIAAYQVRSAAYVVAFVAIAWGMLCPNPVTRSGPSSSPQPSA